MKRRILVVSVMILLIGSEVQIYARKRGGPDFKRPGMEMKMDRRPGRPMYGKAICQGDIERVRDFYLMKYGIRLSRREARKILIIEMNEKHDRPHVHRKPRPYRNH